MSRPFPFLPAVFLAQLPFLIFCGDGTHLTFTDSVIRGEVAVKDQLESVVLQMYRAGVRCSEAVREFQGAFILTVLKDQRGNQCRAAKKLGIHRNTLRRTIRDLEIDIGPTRAIGQGRPPRPGVKMPPVRRRVSYPSTFHRGYLAVHPPSMRIVSPVIRDAALEARNTTTPATSIGSPMRCSAAMRLMTSDRTSGLARQLSVPGVRIKVGATAFTVMLYFPHSTARHLVRWAMAAFVMQYTDSVGSATNPAWELRLMMRPLFCWIMTRPAA